MIYSFNGTVFFVPPTSSTGDIRVYSILLSSCWIRRKTSRDNMFLLCLEIRCPLSVDRTQRVPRLRPMRERSSAQNSFYKNLGKLHRSISWSPYPENNFSCICLLRRQPWCLFWSSALSSWRVDLLTYCPLFIERVNFVTLYVCACLPACLLSILTCNTQTL